MTNEGIGRFFNNTQAFIQGNSDLRDPQVEGWFRTRQHFRNSSEHSQSNEAPVTLPAPDELQSDLEALKNWRDDFCKRGTP